MLTLADKAGRWVKDLENTRFADKGGRGGLGNAGSSDTKKLKRATKCILNYWYFGHIMYFLVNFYH